MGDERCQKGGKVEDEEVESVKGQLVSGKCQRGPTGSVVV